jgi:hypothetical protein
MYSMIHPKSPTLQFLVVEDGLKTLRNGQKRSYERSGTFEPERSFALERIMESIHGTFKFTLQNEKTTSAISYFS